MANDGFPDTGEVVGYGVYVVCRNDEGTVIEEGWSNAGYIEAYSTLYDDRTDADDDAECWRDVEGKYAPQINVMVYGFTATRLEGSYGSGAFGEG